MRVLITGAARAIGYATAACLAERGHSVVATARKPELIEPRSGIEAVKLDVTDQASVDGCLEAVGEIDVLVNNAGIAGAGPLEDFPLERFQSILETNTIGPLRMIQALAPQWRSRGHGVIVNVSSVQGQVSSPMEGPYSASKFALEALSETLHYELGHFGIRVVIVQPGYIAPGMKQAPEHEGPSDYDELRAQWQGTADSVIGPNGRTSPEAAASIICDAIEDPNTPLRVRIGPDAELILDTRSQLSDSEFESAMRSTLSLDW